jgi:hypothetical protein
MTHYDIIVGFYRTYLKIQLNIRRKPDLKLGKPAAGSEFTNTVSQVLPDCPPFLLLVSFTDMTQPGPRIIRKSKQVLCQDLLHIRHLLHEFASVLDYLKYSEFAPICSKSELVGCRAARLIRFDDCTTPKGVHVEAYNIIIIFYSKV